MFEKCENEVELERQVTRLHIDFWCNVELCFMITATQNNYTVCNTYMNIFPHKTNNCNWQKLIASPKDCSTDWKGATFYSGMEHNWFPDVTSEDRNRKISYRFVLFSSAYCVNVKYTLLAEKELNSGIFSSFFTECLIWNWRTNLFQNVTDTKQTTMISWEIQTMYKSCHSLQICATFGKMLNMAITREFGTLAGSGLW